MGIARLARLSEEEQERFICSLPEGIKDWNELHGL